MFGLFKEKLSAINHKYIVNYLVSEEAGQQWQYHVIENNFNKDFFRGAPFAKGTVNMFIQHYLKMKADDKILSLIVDLGYRKCREWIDNYKDFETIIQKKKYEDLLKIMSTYVYFMNQVDTGKIFSEIKFDHNRAMSEGMKHIDFRKRFKEFNVFIQIMRDMHCYTKTIMQHKKSLALGTGELDILISQYEEKTTKLTETKKNEILQKIIKESEKKFEQRSQNNELGN
jgi:hypothetical protein